MQLRLRTKLTLIMTGLVLLVVAVLSAVFVAQLFEQVLQQTDKRAQEIAAQVFELDLPLTNGDEPFGAVRVVVSSALLLHDISGSVRKSGTIVLLALVFSTVVAAVVSRATLAPLGHISEQLDRISAGQYDAPSPEVKGLPGGTDELGQVSRKISQVGQQLRGVHEIFSS